MADEHNDVAGQVAEVRRIAEVGFTDVAGKLALIRQGQEQGERRHAELASTVCKFRRSMAVKFRLYLAGPTVLMSFRRARALECSRWHPRLSPFRTFGA